jgi:hypothetical protein
MVKADMNKISIIIPVYYNEHNVPLLCKDLNENFIQKITNNI